MSLLDKALSQPKSPVRGDFNAELLEVVMAWMRGEVSTGQCICAKLATHPNGWHYRAARIIRKAILDGKVLITLNGDK